ncbi:exonuclease SbcCD subunit D [Agreia pratensis]|uniref:exonuclease SbcCD subunit D n=1 Tax=Agreia pratensis TaxID=150121 RepID=UPI00188AE1CC|nr:exonuclease SbcCD subunit D [Agreia pratensis]MBF4635064.1 exonuclease SbcCD subunit D [Agreia pratensis]
MRILHTSDWHIGRTFHGHSTLENLSTVLDALTAVVREKSVDVVVVAGDIFDSATPAREAFDVLSRAIRQIREAGAYVVITSGNHDSATRLGFQSEWAGLAGIHVIARPDQFDEPVVIDDAYGPVLFYGIPYLEPALVRHLYPGVEMRRHAQVLGYAMQRIREDIARRDGARSVVLSHAFVVNVAGGAGGVGASAVGAASSEASDVERDITAGGLDLVSVDVFDGPDYVALGHIHGRSTLTPAIRYSGAPLHYSFGEATKPRGAWLVELDAAGLDTVEWVDLPVPRPLTVLTGELAELLADPSHASAEGHFVSVVLTDQVRPIDGMRRIQTRFPHAVALTHQPAVVAELQAASYSERLHARSDSEVVAGFLEFVRNGVGPTDAESELIVEVIAEQAAQESTA